MDSLRRLSEATEVWLDMRDAEDLVKGKEVCRLLATLTAVLEVLVIPVLMRTVHIIVFQMRKQ